MTFSIEGLSYDVLFNICLYLNIDEVLHLSNSCKSLRFLLKEETLCRQLIVKCAEHTLEASLAHDEDTKYCYEQAVRRIYKRRKALSEGKPVSASIIAYASDFIFNEGVVCLLGHDAIQFLDLQKASMAPRIPFKSLPKPAASLDPHNIHYRLMNYNENILALLCHDDSTNTDYLFAIDICTGDAVMPLKRIDNINRLFVRHTREVLFFGCHTGYGTHGHREWIIQAVSFTDQRFQKYCKISQDHVLSDESEPIQLYNFPGTDVGSTVVFKIYNGYFYALSNCSAFEVVEVDWTSFYHCIRFPINDPRRERCHINTRIYRRQHHEGPINDNWTWLDLQVDERIDQLLIVEARTEWTSGGTTQTRTFYTQKIPPMDSLLAVEEEDRTKVGPVGDLFSSIPDDDSKYSPWQEREPWQFHPEKAHGGMYDDQKLGSSAPFILARTKFRSYNLSTGTFVDLVQTTCNCRGGNLCLHLRTGTRQEKPPLEFLGSSSFEDTSCEGKAPTTLARSSCPSPIPPELLQTIPCSYNYRRITMWPPHFKSSNNAARIHAVMNADPQHISLESGIQVKAHMDERCIVYLVLPCEPSGSRHSMIGKVVCLSFDGDVGVEEPPACMDHSDCEQSVRTPQQLIEDEDMKDTCFSPPPNRRAPSFEPWEANRVAYETIWDEYPDAEDLDFEQVWAESFCDGFGTC
ncbi:hypothetical protein EJ08DRAFT_647800 [Tothia fuscella]|uniref:F-box domain-containing protein n=1 Tax=Tothia fuscella TaxID=1048955 RepID=A0A9P4NW02_9PEZI|nr:hypothetical protein EJ08DRAFT_647800 [Tothia fuscella]